MNTQHSLIRRLEIVPLPAFQDNYIWLLRVGNIAAVVDPGDARVVEHYVDEHALDLVAILLTHHHADHVGGVAALASRHALRVYGPAAADIAEVTHALHDGDEVALPELDVRFLVWAVPGHTSTHIAYLSPGILFPGDTLFSAGCGRLLGGTAAQLHDSLQRLATLPDDTRVYCTHEYTLSNLVFAQVAEPENHERDDWLASCHALRDEGLPTLPSTIAREKNINPFLRTSRASVIEAVMSHTGRQPADTLACFTALRAWKDAF